VKTIDPNELNAILVTGLVASLRLKMLADTSRAASLGTLGHQVKFLSSSGQTCVLGPLDEKGNPDAWLHFESLEDAFEWAARNDLLEEPW
jgi:hypothetical protein